MESTPKHRSLRKIDPDRVEARSGGGCVSIFGLPFLLAGLFILQIPLGLLPVEHKDAMPWYFFAAFGGVFATVGTILVFGRRGVIVDRRRGVVRQWRGLLVPMKGREQSLDEVQRVAIRKTSGDDSSDTYPVTLEGGSMKAVPILSPTDYAEARSVGEDLARFLSRPVVDSSSGTQVVRQPDTLDQTLQEKVQAMRAGTLSLPDPPWDMKTRIREMPDGILLEIPHLRINLPRWVRWGAALVCAGVAVLFFSRFLELPEPRPIRYAFVSFFVVFFLLGPAVTVLRRLRKKHSRCTFVAVTPALLRVEESGGTARVTEIPADELEELELPTRQGVMSAVELPGRFSAFPLPDTGTPRLPDGRPMPRFLASLIRLVPSPGILARSDNASVQFGAGLPEEELRYIHSLILHTLTRRDNSIP